MSHFITFKVEMIPSNEGVIKEITEMLMNIPKSPSNKSTSSNSKASGSRPSFEQFKKAVQAAQREHGAAFIKEVFEKANVEGSTVPKLASACPEERYSSLMEIFASGPVEEADEDSDEWEDEEEEDAEVSVDSVKAAAKAYGQEHSRDKAKSIMKKHGASSLAEIGNLSKTKLTALFKALQ